MDPEVLWILLGFGRAGARDQAIGIVEAGGRSGGFIVNDPYGEYFQSGYDNRRSGAGLHYSYGLIARTCSPESQQDPQNLWIHSLFRV